MRTRFVLAVVTLALASCTRGASTPPAATATTSASREVLPFIHDDFPKALAEAKRQNKPLFVDAWAPWCHSCQSLRTFVLTDPVLAPLAPRFVWLSVDTEKSVNEGFVARFPHEALPTLWVLDPATERPLMKWAGTATATELAALLGVAVGDGAHGGGRAIEATAAFVRGNQLLASGDVEGADGAYRTALAAADKDHPHRARIVEALVTELAMRHENAGCADVADKEAPSLPTSTSRASVLVTALGCAHDAKRPPEEIARLRDLASHDASARGDVLLPDDRAALYEQVVTTKEESGDAAGARATATEWATFLEGEAARARTTDARASLDPWLLSAYLALRQPERAIPMLERSERDFPDDYNPPARLGRAFLEMKRFDEASEAADRAVKRVYGPRVMRVYALKADIAKARGDKGAEIVALEEALAKSEHAVLTQGQNGVRNGLVKRLAALRAAAH